MGQGSEGQEGGRVGWHASVHPHAHSPPSGKLGRNKQVIAVTWI